MAILDSYELLEIILGIYKEPQATPDPIDPIVIIPPHANALRAWKQRNVDAMCALVTSTTDSILTLIQHTTKAAEAWDVLQNQYETHSQ